MRNFLEMKNVDNEEAKLIIRRWLSEDILDTLSRNIDIYRYLGVAIVKSFGAHAWINLKRKAFFFVV